VLLGLNSPLASVAAIFHIMNHATFKASLFMGSASSITKPAPAISGA